MFHDGKVMFSSQGPGIPFTSGTQLLCSVLGHRSRVTDPEAARPEVVSVCPSHWPIFRSLLNCVFFTQEAVAGGSLQV